MEYDKGLDGTGNHNDAMWQYISSRIELNRGTDGTTVLNKYTNYDYLNVNKEGSSSDFYDWNTPFCIEFYFEKLNSDSTINSQIQLFDKENDAFTKWLTQTGNYRIEVRENQVRWWINDQEQTPTTLNLGQCLIRWFIQSGASFKFRDFKIYPI